MNHIDNQALNELISASKTVADILQKNFHPRTTVVIEVNSIRVEETLTQQLIEYAAS